MTEEERNKLNELLLVHKKYEFGGPDEEDPLYEERKVGSCDEDHSILEYSEITWLFELVAKYNG